MYTFYFYVHPTNSRNNFSSFTVFTARKMTRSVEGGVDEEEQISCGGPP